jgi:hypothetical protein
MFMMALQGLGRRLAPARLDIKLELRENYLNFMRFAPDACTLET